MTSPPAADAFVRPAEPSDADQLGLIQVASWRLTHAAELGDDVVSQFDPALFAEQWRQALRTHRASRTHALLVACAGVEVVGFAAMQPSPDPDAPGDGTSREITALFVEPTHWRVGHGSRLLAACSDAARATGGAELRTWVTGGDTARAEFVESAGFALDGAWRQLEVAPGRTMTERRWVAALS